MRRAWFLVGLQLGGCGLFLGVDDLVFDRPDGMIEYTDELAGPLFIDPTEVTNRDYAAWLATEPTSATDASCAWNTSFVPGDWTPNGVENAENCTAPAYAWETARDQLPGRPVACIDWCDAAAYCESQGKRLCGGIAGMATSIRYDNPTQTFVNDEPSSSAWYLACSRGGALAYPYGETYDADACNGSTGALDDTGSRPRCEGGYPGVFDMSGNIEEWEDACVDASAESACARRGGAFYSAQVRDPSWLRCEFLLTASRRAMAPSIGARCCWEPEP